MNNNTWNYKVELKDTSVFERLEKQLGISIPEELKNFIIENNGASPSLSTFMLNNNEESYNYTLSFNTKETDEYSNLYIFDTLKPTDPFPFANDPFGNLICYDLKTNKICFWEHETDQYIQTDLTLSEFIDSLY